jgi:hypothetical protein
MSKVGGMCPGRENCTLQHSIVFIFHSSQENTANFKGLLKQPWLLVHKGQTTHIRADR